jgi:hypothetical protein
LIKSITCCIIVLSSITLYLSSCIGKPGAFDRMINIGSIVILFHGAFVLLCEVCFPLEPYIDAAAPFGLIYGPLCFLSFYAISGKMPKRSSAFLHFVPAIIGLILYFLLLLLPSFRAAYLEFILHWLYIFIAISMMGYTGLLLFYNGVDEKERAQEGKTMVFSVFILVFIVALLIGILIYSGAISRKEAGTVLPRMVVYFTMLTVMVFVFRYQVNRMLKK